ncbi:MAG TPA: hypothetical protein VGR15_01720 [Bacteroidota bacterium]|nr:hypothetical protein [Bacteroidota bacterium]
MLENKSIATSFSSWNMITEKCKWVSTHSIEARASMGLKPTWFVWHLKPRPATKWWLRQRSWQFNASHERY